MCTFYFCRRLDNIFIVDLEYKYYKKNSTPPSPTTIKKNKQSNYCNRVYFKILHNSILFYF